MRCPWCEFEGQPRQLHAHLAERHEEGVTFEERGSRMIYAVKCPLCGEGYEHPIKPGSNDPSFLQEYQREIRLVGFDMLVNHMLGEHE
ncbi:MAG: hypothetical protein ACYDH5_18890 [Acidimicrobiales bacterium]